MVNQFEVARNLNPHLKLEHEAEDERLYSLTNSDQVGVFNLAKVVLEQGPICLGLWTH